MRFAMPLPDDVVAGLDAGIRRTVLWLRERGHDTCDSGDGTKGTEGAMPVPHVIIRTPACGAVMHAACIADDLSRSLGITVEPIGGGISVQVTIDMADDTALIAVLGLCDALLGEA